MSKYASSQTGDDAEPNPHPLTVDQFPTEYEQKLCEVCRGIDLDKLAYFTHGFATSAISEHGIFLSPVKNQLKSESERDCALCRIFWSLAPVYERKGRLELRLFDRLKAKRTGEANIPLSPFLAVLKPINRNLRHRKSFHHFRNIELTTTCILEYQSQSARPGCLRLVEASINDSSLFKSWILDCKISHRGCRSQGFSKATLAHIHLIDCQKRVVIKAKPTEKYIALSYVWGSQATELSELPEEPAQLQNAPLTVTDAMRVVQELGERYLWVDKYCASESDHGDQKAMIHGMDQIYEGAEATIVALYGQDHHAGLPGVSKVKRSAQACVYTEAGRIVASRPQLQRVVQLSKWNTRDWTFQEARLSRRCLFFTEEQVYFCCQHSTLSEACPVPASTCWTAQFQNAGSLSPSLLGTEGENSFCADVAAFTSRELSREDDALNAFRGILTRSPHFSLWGVPILLPSQEVAASVGFAVGLLWTVADSNHPQRLLQIQPKRVEGRRRGFPSWSWTGVKAPIRSAWHDTMEKRQLIHRTYAGCREPDVRFWQCSNRGTVPLEMLISRSNLSVLPETSSELIVEGTLFKAEAFCSYKRIRYRLTNSQAIGDAFSEWDLAYSPDLCAISCLNGDDTISGQNVRGSRKKWNALLLLEIPSELQCKTGQPFPGACYLMLLNWVEEGRAERAGLLYADNKPHSVKSFPSVRYKFILQ